MEKELEERSVPIPRFSCAFSGGFMFISTIFKWIFRSPPPRPDQSVIPHFLGGMGKEEKKTGRRKTGICSGKGGKNKSKTISGRDIPATKSKEKEHPRGRKANPTGAESGSCTCIPREKPSLGSCSCLECAEAKQGPRRALGAGNREPLLLPKSFFGMSLGPAAPPGSAIAAFLSREKALPLLGMWEMRVGRGKIGIFQVCERWESFAG